MVWLWSTNGCQVLRGPPYTRPRGLSAFGIHGVVNGQTRRVLGVWQPESDCRWPGEIVIGIRTRWVSNGEG